MTTSSSSKDKFFEKVINPYLPEVMKHPVDLEMHERVLHMCDFQGPKKEVRKKVRLAAVEKEIFKCQGMVERGWSANHSITTDFIREKNLDARNMGEALFKLQEGIEIVCFTCMHPSS
ncbi:hypothetical protein D1007_37158 [Hordeum vulgare]|nr:hypothetical protein D1007_37158 [Hordeum vulgare]